MEHVVISYGNSVCFTYIHTHIQPVATYILWPFGIISGHLVHFFSFLYVVPRKTWQP
jgi:hypothetical protein